MKIFIPLICYNYTCHTSFMMSLMGLLLEFERLNISATVFPITFDSLISRARNAAVAHFMADKTNTHLLFIDSDIEFNVDDVLKLMNADKDVVCGAYAKKWLDISKVQQGKPLEVCTSTSCHLIPQKIAQHMECVYATTGFLLIKREVINVMMHAYPDREYINDVDGYASTEDIKFYNFFTVEVNTETKRYESEDYGFSKLWRNIGGKIFVIPDITLIHYGWFGYRANLYQQLIQ